MATKSITFKRSEMWIIATITFVVMIAILPFFIAEKTDAQTTSAPPNSIIAILSGSAIGGMTPRGTSVSTTFVGMPGSTFQTDVSSVNLPPQTALTVSVNGTNVGQIVLSPAKSGTFRISGNAPVIVSGSTVAVKNGTATILAGTFFVPATPSPTPTVSPTATPTPHPTFTPHPTPSLVLFSPLTGATINGVMPKGVGQYVAFGTSSKSLGVFVNRVSFPTGTILKVKLNAIEIGQITLSNFGEGSLRLNSTNGTVPTVVSGDTLSVLRNDITVLTGTFRAQTPMPTPSPTVSPTPNGSPTPTPTPRPARFFDGRMQGSQVVPPVTGMGRGFIGISLNSTETQIKVSVGYFGLSSNAANARIYGPAETGSTGEQIFDLGTVTGTSGRVLDKTFDVTSAQVAQLRAGMWYLQIATVNNANGEIRGQVRSRSRHSGFSGTVVEDIAVYRQSSGIWYINNGNGYTEKALGQAGDIPMSADYDGDGLTDVAVYRGGSWIISRSSDNGTTNIQFGLPTDIPVRGDFDGDGQNDVTVFRASTGVWYSSLSSNGSLKAIQFGIDGDIPITSDLDGDGISEICVFRPSTGVWYRIESRTGQFKADQFGMFGDIPMTGDFDGDGRDDITVFRQSTGNWYVLASSTNSFYGVQFGAFGDIPVASDMDGDGVTDISVFRPSNGFWYMLRSIDGTFDYKQFGINGDFPTAAR